MSHTAKVDIQFKDIPTLLKVCDENRIEYTEDKSVKFYDGKVHKGLAIYVGSSRYPIVINHTGMYMDDFYMDQRALADLKTKYGIKKVKQMASKKGYRYKEVVKDGRQQIKIYVTA